jgi:hypothetical protein
MYLCSSSSAILIHDMETMTRVQKHLRVASRCCENLPCSSTILSANMLVFFLCLLSLTYGEALIKREQQAFEVLSPTAGDTIALAESSSDGLFLNISWIAPEATADRPASISLVQGNNISSLALLHVINGTKPPPIIRISALSLIVSCSKYNQQRITQMVRGRLQNGPHSRL